MARPRNSGTTVALAIPLLMLLLAWMTSLVCAATEQQAMPSQHDWSVKSIVRSIDLGAVATLTDTHVIEVPKEVTSEQDIKPYFFILNHAEAQRISGLEANARYGPGILSKQRAVLSIKQHGPVPVPDTVQQSAPAMLYSVRFPLQFQQRGPGEDGVDQVTLIVSGMLVHASQPLPIAVGQGETQSLLWKGSAAPVCPYGAASVRTKVKAPQPTILSYDTSPPLDAEQMTKSGATVTFGPFSEVQPWLQGESWSTSTTTPVVAEAEVHYPFPLPVLTVVTAQRTAKISHWRNRLDIEDKLWLRNDGARLKGHFSRVQHQLNALVQRIRTHTLTNMVLHLPPGATDAFFIDESGNVSTSHFRSMPPSPDHVRTPAHLLSTQRASILDLRPRYPLLGGWNYTCTVGWAVKLSDGWMKMVEEAERRFQVAIPFAVAVKDVAVDVAEMRIILPEGASNINFVAPFAVEVENERTWNFLDTVGKPVLRLHKPQCSERHGGMVLVEYTLETSDHWRKAFVALLAGTLIAGTLRLLNKVDLRLH